MTIQDTKRLFWKLGTCSHTLCHILNREFGHLKETEERAAEPLAGGLALRGCQCGMLWGASLAVGAESFRRHDDRSQAIGVAIMATRHVLESFSKRAGSVNCSDITRSDFSKSLVLAAVKYFVTGRFITCTNLAGNWAPEAILAATEGLARGYTDFAQPPTSCASEVAQKMGASEEEMVMVAGFAGGMGLSGNGCGALGAAMWMHALTRLRDQVEEITFPDPKATATLRVFHGATDSEILCHSIAGQYFETVDDHTEFVKNGGCGELIDALARS